MEENTTLNVQLNISVLEDLNRQTTEILLPVIIVFSILSIVGAIGNSLVFYIWITRFSRSISNTCVLLLAFLDLITCTFGIPMEVYKLSNQFYFDSPPACKVYRFVIDFCVNSSISLLLVLAIIRYYAVRKPLKVFPLKSKGIILLSVGAGLCLSWPVLILHGTQIKPTKYPELNGVDCGIDEAFATSPFRNIYFSVLGIVFVVCCILLSGLYACIGLTIYRRNRRKCRNSRTSCGRQDSSSTGNTDEKGDRTPDGAGSHRRSSIMWNKLFFAITLVFVLSFLPSLTMLAIKAQNRQIETTLPNNLYVGYFFCFKTYLINSCVNPVLYGFMNRLFQKEIRKLFTSLKDKFGE